MSSFSYFLVLALKAPEVSDRIISNSQLVIRNFQLKKPSAQIISISGFIISNL